MKIFAGSIDLMKLNKERGREHKNGAVYFDVTIVLNDTPDEYGNHISIQQGQTKEEREGKAPRVYLGNCKLVHEK